MSIVGFIEVFFLKSGAGQNRTDEQKGAMHIAAS